MYEKGSCAMEMTIENVKAMFDSSIEQAQELIKDSSKVDELLLQLEKSLKDIPEVGDVLSDIPVLIAMVKGYITKQYTAVSPKVIVTIIGAFIYFVKKHDIIADHIPVVGKIDDLAVLAFALRFVEPELNAYKEWRDGGCRTAPVSEEPAAASSAEEMTFDELLDKVRSIAESVDASDHDFLAVQVNITGDNGGVFYVEVKDGVINIEPYEYNDRNCAVTMSLHDFVELIEGKLDPVKAFALGKLEIDGDPEKALEFSNLLRN